MAGIYGIIFGLILFYGLFSHVPILGISLSVVCGSCLLFSSIRMNRKLHHDEKVQLADLLSGFSHCFKCVGLSLWIGIWVTLWSCLLVIPGIVKLCSYSMAFYFLEENPRISIREALNRSKKLTNGRKSHLFVLQLSWLGWITLSILTFGLSLLWLMPYMGVTEYAAFADMQSQESHVFEG
jgi:uncharacterized membrane protein